MEFFVSVWYSSFWHHNFQNRFPSSNGMMILLDTIEVFTFINPKRNPRAHLVNCQFHFFHLKTPQNSLHVFSMNKEKFQKLHFLKFLYAQKIENIFQNGIVCNCNDHMVKLGGSFKYDTRTGSLLQLNSQLPGLNLAATAARRSERLKIEASSSLDDNQTVKLVLKR